MKYAITFLKETTQYIDAASLEGASYSAARLAYREEGMKVLSVIALRPGESLPPKKPTPFDRPPSGTPGAGQMRVTSMDLVAVAA